MEESFFLKLLFNMRWLPGKWIKDRKSQKEERKKKKKGIERGRVFFFFFKLLFNIWWLPGKWMEMVYVSKKKKKRKRKEQENEREKLMVQIVGIEWERDEGTIWFLKNHHSSLTQFLSFIIL